MELENIREGIVKNMAVKNKWNLDVDQVIEGNSYFGICIFIGVASMYGFKEQSVKDFLSISMEERDFMEDKFIRILKDSFDKNNDSVTAKRFQTKVNLILNYIRNEFRKTVSLKDIIENKV
tara:strand:+ start:263 stop:625 length:363 start_codon:yes stop_codon:yes gene_type:complete